MATIQNTQVIFLDDCDILEAFEFYLAEKHGVKMIDEDRQRLEKSLANTEMFNMFNVKAIDEDVDTSNDKRIAERLYNNFKVLQQYAAENKVHMGVVLYKLTDMNVRRELFKLFAENKDFGNTQFEFLLDTQYVEIDVMGNMYVSSHLPSVALASLARQISINEMMSTDLTLNKL